MITISLQWRHIERDGVSKYWRLDCLFNRLFRHRSKKKSKLRVSVLCEGISPVTDEFPARMASNAENVSIWWRHNVNRLLSTDACSIKCVFNLLLPHDAMWRHRYGSKLARVMSCYLRAPNNYLNQCWLISTEFQWQSYEGNFTTDTSVIKISLNYLSIISFISPWGQWVKWKFLCSLL